ncbi:hypothetical protein HPB47_023142, partial [Ixodes persulcatus]
TPTAVGGWARYSVLSPTGELLVRNVSSSDDGISYRCQTRHRLTGKAKISDTAGRVIVNPSTGPFQPRHIFSRSSVSVDQGKTAQLVCVAHGYSVPEYRWYKLSGGTNESREPLHQGGRFSVSGGTLSIRHAAVSDSGRYLCVANNSLASEPFTVTLTVMAPLSAVVVPDEQTVDLGGSATFSCVPSGHPVTSLVWLKDGRTLRQGDPRIQVSPESRSLGVRPVAREDAGMYQCLVKNDQDSAQGAARLKLGFSAPTFLSVFSEQSAEPGRGVSLQCSATGSPMPRITWSLDGTSLAADPRVRSGDRVAAPNHVTSFVNISAARTEDGGLYACAASNGAGSVEHAARLNVAGPLRVRPMVPVRAVAGGPLRLDCHYAGHPVDRISWTRGGVHLPSSKRQEVLRNGSLVISEVRQYEDNGTYTCHVSGPLGQSTSGTVTVNVRVRPTIAPFSFPGGLQAGMRARLGCTVISGDPPFEFDWRKDGRPLGPELGVRAQTDAFSSDLTFASLGTRHNGNYSCVVSNAAASASHSASLVVQVGPNFDTKFRSEAVQRGGPARLRCEAQGDPPVTLTWAKDGQSLGPPATEQRYTFREDPTSSPRRAISILEISSVERRDAALFTCRASNAYGGDDLNIKLIVQEPPEPPTNVKASEVKSRSLKLSWTASLGGNSAVSRYHIHCQADSEFGPLPQKPKKKTATMTTPSLVVLHVAARTIESFHGTNVELRCHGPDDHRKLTARPRHHPDETLNAAVFSRLGTTSSVRLPGRPSPRKTAVWRTADRRPLCYHCVEADHIYRHCPYRQMELRLPPERPTPTLRLATTKDSRVPSTTLVTPACTSPRVSVTVTTTSSFADAPTPS